MSFGIVGVGGKGNRNKDLDVGDIWKEEYIGF